MSNSKLVYSTHTGQVTSREHARRVARIKRSLITRRDVCHHGEQHGSCEICLDFDSQQCR